MFITPNAIVLTLAAFLSNKMIYDAYANVVNLALLEEITNWVLGSMPHYMENINLWDYSISTKQKLRKGPDDMRCIWWLRFELRRMKDDHQYWDCEYWKAFNTLIFPCDIGESDITDEKKRLSTGPGSEKHLWREVCLENNLKHSPAYLEWRREFGNGRVLLSPDLIHNPNQNFHSITNLHIFLNKSKGTWRDEDCGSSS